MKKIQLYLFLTVAVAIGFIGGNKFYSWRLYRHTRLAVPSLEKELVQKQAQKERPILLIVDAEDSPLGLLNCLQSIETQSYGPYEVLITAQKLSESDQKIIENFVSKYPTSSALILGKKSEIQERIAARVDQLSDEALVIPFNANNWLSNDYVLKLVNLNQEENRFKLLLGQYLHYPSYEQGVTNKRTRNQILKRKLPKDETLPFCFKAFRADFLKNNRQVDLSSLESLDSLKKLFVQFNQGLSFCRFVLYIRNECQGEDELLIFNTPSSK